MDETIQHHQTSTTLGNLMKSLTTNAIFLQAREQATVGTTSSEKLQSLLKRVLPLENHEFSLLPIAPGGRFKDLDRYLLIWDSMTAPHSSRLSTHQSDKAIKMIVKASAEDGFGYSLREVNKRERDQMVVYATKLEESNQAKLLEKPWYLTALSIIQGVFGPPRGEASLHASTPSINAGQQDAENDIHQSSYNTNKDLDTSQKGKGAIGEEEPGTGVADERKQMGIRQDSKNKTARMDKPTISGIGLGIEGLQSLLDILTDMEKNGGHLPDFKLTPPPVNHPTTSILRPVVTPPSVYGPEQPQEPKRTSPLDYETNIGNAAVVHRIYLEARRTDIPRTEEQELARRQRACEMAIREIRAVIDETEWHRKGRGYDDGPKPSVFEGINLVPKEKRRAWVLEKRAIVKERQRQVRANISDNNEASDHIYAVTYAVLACSRAGREGIVL